MTTAPEPNTFAMTIYTEDGQTLTISGSVLSLDIKPAGGRLSDARIVKCSELMAKFEARNDRQSRYKLRTWRANYLGKRLSPQAFDARLRTMEAKLAIDNEADANLLEQQLRGSLAVTKKKRAQARVTSKVTSNRKAKS
jgi:hypothetical protein